MKINQTYLIDGNIEYKIRKNNVDAILKQIVFNFKCEDLYNMDKLELMIREINSIKKSAFKDFPKLTELYINEASIAKLEANCFGELNSLKRLDISMNINEIEPNAFNGLVNLKHLSLISFDTAIKSIEADTFKGLSNLNELLFRCEKREEDEDYQIQAQNLFIHLANLKKLKFYNYVFLRVDKDFFTGLSQLQFLDIRSNNLRQIDANGLNCLTKLEHFSCTENFLEVFDFQCVANLPNLKKLSLSSNAIESLTNEAIQLSNEKIFSMLENIELPDNKLTELKQTDFQNMINLSKLDVSGNQIQTIEAKTFNSQRKLTKLDLNKNVLTKINVDMFQGLAYLNHIILSHNKISFVEANSFSPLIHLIILDISSNQLTSIDKDMFTGLHKLELVDLASNKISRIEPKSFDDLVSLKKLIIMVNSLTTLDHDFLIKYLEAKNVTIYGDTGGWSVRKEVKDNVLCT